MRISSQQLVSQALAGILRQQAKLNHTQNQIASGKRIQTPSDDPIGASKVLLLNQEIERIHRFDKNTSSALNQLTLREHHLKRASDLLFRVRELQIQANSQLIGKGDRVIIKGEIQGILNDLSGLANTQDSNGNYLYSGYQSTVKPFIQDNTGNFLYQGDSGAQFLEISSGVNVQMNDSGRSVFEGFRNGNGTFDAVDALVANTGTVVVTHTELVDVSLSTKDSYTLTFVTNGSGELAYQIIGATAGQVIPAPPLVIPTDAPSFQSGQTITFDGLQLTIEGTPNVGDDFSITPSVSQSVFTTLNNIIKDLDRPYNTSVDKATIRTLNTKNQMEIDQALDTFISLRADLGRRLIMTENAQDMNADLLLGHQSTLSNIEDLDLSKAITDLTFRTTALDAAQQAFARIQNLSLFNYI